MSETRTCEIPLIEEINQGVINLAMLTGMDVNIDIGFGDYVPCKIIEIINLPALNNPDCPDDGYHDTFHLILQAYEAELNINEYGYPPIMIYRIYPLEYGNIFRMIEEPRDLANEIFENQLIQDDE